MSADMGFALLSSCATGFALLLAVVSGTTDWSRTFATVWFGLLALAAVCAVLAVGCAVFGHEPLRRRLLIVMLAFPAPLVLAVVAYFMYAVLPGLR